jgi:FkbM family methyltransferase
LFCGWDVYAFEPDPDNARHIPKKQGVRVFDNAISDQDGVVPFYNTPVSNGMSSLTKLTPSHRLSHTTVVRRLDTLLPELGIDKVDYLKIDAEGYDLMVLKGFPWDAIRPSVVMCEFSDDTTAKLGYKHDDIVNYMAELGYFVIVSEWAKPIKVSGRYRHAWLGFFRYPCPDRELNWGNMIFAENEELYNRLCRKAGL